MAEGARSGFFATFEPGNYLVCEQILRGRFRRVGRRLSRDTLRHPERRFKHLFILTAGKIGRGEPVV